MGVVNKLSPNKVHLCLWRSEMTNTRDLWQNSADAQWIVANRLINKSSSKLSKKEIIYNNKSTKITIQCRIVLPLFTGMLNCTVVWW